MRTPITLRSAAGGGLCVLAAWLCGLFWLPTAHAAAGPCAGAGATLTANTTWATDCTLGGTVTVGGGVTLTVAAGVRVSIINPNTWIIVNGSLRAQGTAGALIHFTSGEAVPEPGQWGRIFFSQTSTNNLLDRVIVAYGGAGIEATNALVEIRTSGLIFSNSTIQHSMEDGIRIRDASPTLTALTIAHNGSTSYGRALDLFGASRPQLSGLSATDNGFDGIAVNGSSLTSNHRWGDGGLASYLVVDEIAIEVGATLTIAPGTTVYLDNPNTDFRVRGSLWAVGSAAAPIRFTSGDDFTPGGSPAGQIGDWGSIRFESSATNSLLEYATVEHGGGIFFGVEMASSGVTIRRSTIARNGNGGIRVNGGSPTITLSNLVENEGFGLYGVQNLSDGMVDATCNWWGTASGPVNSGNIAGTGQQASEGVIFTPWRVAAAPSGACSGGSRLMIALILR